MILVKGEFTPASVRGTIRYGDHNPTHHKQPIEEAGVVKAIMKTRLDPYTGMEISGPLSDGVGYFNAAANGQYELLGLAPGIYNIYASAAGYPTAPICFDVTILKGQSLQFDGSLQPGAAVHGTVSSKRGFDNVPWQEDAYVKIEIYNAPTLRHEPDQRAKPVVWSGESDVVAKGSRDVGPHQNWRVKRGTLTPLHFAFGVKGEYGVPTGLVGMVPQTYATWVNGLTPGRYYVRAWVSGYTQSTADGSTFLEKSFQVNANEWAEDVKLEIDVRLRSD